MRCRSYRFTYRVVVVFGLDDSNGNIGLVVEQIIDFFGFSAPYVFAPYDHPPFGKVKLLTDLSHQIPLRIVRTKKGRGNELCPHVRFSEFFLVHNGAPGTLNDSLMLGRMRIIESVPSLRSEWQDTCHRRKVCDVPGPSLHGECPALSCEPAILRR